MADMQSNLMNYMIMGLLVLLGVNLLVAGIGIFLSKAIDHHTIGCVQSIDDSSLRIFNTITIYFKGGPTVSFDSNKTAYTNMTPGHYCDLTMRGSILYNATCTQEKFCNIMN